MQLIQVKHDSKQMIELKKQIIEHEKQIIKHEK